MERAIRIARDVGDTETEAWASAAIAEVAYMAGDVSGARVGAQRGFELAERLGAPFSRTQTNAHLAWVLLLEGQPAAAAEVFEQVREMIADRGTSRGQLPDTFAGLSEAAREQGQLENAIELAEQGLALAGELRTRIHALRCALALSRALRADAAPPDRIESVLARADDVIAETGARNFTPLVAVERAELAALRGDDAERTALLQQALELFRASGATGHAARVEQSL